MKRPISTLTVAHAALLAALTVGCPPPDSDPPDGEPEACGGLLGLACDAGEFCNYPLDALCGAADATGVCEDVPEGCTREYAPVCGCDDRTYDNACMAHAAGVSVASNGECDSPPPGKYCGGFAGNTCTEDEFCNYEREAGGSGCESIPVDGGGVCQPIPDACQDIYQPVCGCDGKTYGNACYAHAEGVSVLHEGECGSPSTTCGGIAGLECGTGQFCNYEPEAGGQGCDGTISDAAGVCQSTPEACDTVYDPVCGCDGKTYGNACEAHRNGVSVARQGECGGVSCDARQVSCLRSVPECPEGEVPSVEGACFGPCVPIESCACDENADCWDPDQYACHRYKGRCGPYVN